MEILREKRKAFSTNRYMLVIEDFNGGLSDSAYRIIETTKDTSYQETEEESSFIIENYNNGLSSTEIASIFSEKFRSISGTLSPWKPINTANGMS